MSFVSAARMPAMAGAEQVVEAIDRRDGVEYAGLALNEGGYDRLRETQLDRVALNFAATDSFSRRNANSSLDEALGAPPRSRGGQVGAAGRRPLPQHTLHGLRECVGGARAWAIVFDASVGGLGGCPFAPKATGNIATEAPRVPPARESVETGVDLDALIGVAEWLEGVLGRPLPGQVDAAGSFAPVAA